MPLSDTSNTPDVRLIRMVLPAALVRDVDQLVLSGQGGYDSRQEFFAEAIQNHVLEVKHGPDPDGQLHIAQEVEEGVRPEATPAVRGNGNGKKAAPGPEDTPSLPPALADAEAIAALHDISETALPVVARGAHIDVGLATFKEEPLFGLHNRDYPSLWALSLAARITADGVAPITDVYAEVTREAWRFARSLRELEEAAPAKLSALFPTNIAKPQSAEEGFRAFALGAVNRKPTAEGKLETSGPLFSWQAIQLVSGESGAPRVGLTPAGWDLVEAMQGLTLAWPHDREFATRFFAHLREHAPWDWAGFEQLLTFVEQRPTRTELAEKFGSWQPNWSAAMQNTNAAGFVARAREWGLLETKLVDGRYALTEFGASTLTERSAA